MKQDNEIIKEIKETKDSIFEIFETKTQIIEKQQKILEENLM